MLESMMKMLIPSRAEVSDVANAVFDGTDALMLSGETAMGDYPVKTVAMMTQIIQQAEIHHELDMYKQVRAPQNSKLPLAQVVAFSACYASNLADVKAIVVLSASGRMARRISKLKPSKRIIALTPSQAVYQKMSLLWGVTPIMVPFGATSEETLALGEALMIENGLLEKDDPVIFCAGTTPLHGITNTMKLVRIGSPTGLQTPEAQTRLEPQAVSAS
jgi:pyruvate kinase